MQFQINTPAESDWAIAAARAAYNASLPQTVTTMVQQPGANEGDPPIEVPTQVANPELLATDGDYLVFVIGKAVTSWAQTHQAVAPPPVVAPVVVSGVPQEVTMRQAQIILSRTPSGTDGVSLLDKVNQIVATQSVEDQITWNKSSTIQRSNALLVKMMPVLGLTSAQVDALFVAAYALGN